MESVTPSASLMKAAHMVEWCAEGTVPDTILFGDVASPPAPKKREVLIEVKASSINVDDVAACQDSTGGGWFWHARTPSATRPLVGGCEYAGVVVECGPGCTRLKVGDRVCGLQDFAGKKMPGTWAEKTLAPEADVVPIPEGISFMDAAAVCMGAFVSGDMFKRAKLSGGARCLVLGASGGLGTVLLKLLRNHKSAPPHIVAVCSGKNAEMVLRVGADEAVDYTKGPFGEQLADKEKFDIVFDFVGGVDTERSALPLLWPGGQFITACGPMQYVGDRKLTCCEWTGWVCGIMKRVMCSSCCCCCTKAKYELAGGVPPLKAEDFNAAVLDAGARAEIALEVPFKEDQLREALRRVASRHTGGKVVINFEL